MKKQFILLLTGFRILSIFISHRELRRQGRQNLYTHLWDIGDGRGGEAVEEKRKKLTFRTVVRRIIVGRNLREGIEVFLGSKVIKIL